MARGLSKLIARVRALAAQRKVRLTLKAVRELSSLGLDAMDACAVLECLRVPDYDRRIASLATGEWMHVFKPVVNDSRLYVKLILRNDCVVVSFHDDDGADDEE